MKKIYLVALTAVLLSSCLTNVNEGRNLGSDNPAIIAGDEVYSHTINTVLITAAASGTDLQLKLGVDTNVAAYQPLTQFCAIGSSSTKPCQCQITWTEINTVSGTNTSVSRKKKLAVTEVQSGLVKCTMTQDFWNEIPNGTTVRMNIVPEITNLSGLNVSDRGYKKGSSVAPTGDFIDDSLTPFRNIYRYTCYSKSKIVTHEITNATIEATITNADDSTTPVKIPLASRFCASPDGGTNCETPRSGYSAQSYYRNLFVRSDKLGEINSTNARYDCPKVLESLPYSAGAAIPGAEKGKYWPLDTTFALATERSTEWSVGVPAASVLMKSGDSTAVDDPGNICTGSSSSDRLKELGTENGGVAWKCMGYAKKPAANGTCGTIVDVNGRVRPLTRLRRYRVVYPSTYQNSGAPAAERPEGDQVYVADRLVLNNAGVPTGNMIYGPKPCNFAWFDHEGVTNRTNATAAIDFQTNFLGTVAGSSIPTYRSTNLYYNNVIANLVNPDGRVLPNLDRDGSATMGPSCAATVTVYDDDGLGLPVRARLLTSNNTRTDQLTLSGRAFNLSEIHINPVEPWLPEYIEDTSFQACVPVADPYLEPPLHFYKNGGGTEVAWCAKVYPTQNPYWLDLNAKKKPSAGTIAARAVNWNAGAGPAPVTWFTSHLTTGAGLDAYNTCTGTLKTDVCTMSLGTGSGSIAACETYLNALDTASAARCDRTVMYDVNQDYRGFPLQAPDDDIQTMLQNDLANDKTFACSYSVHSDPTQVGTAQPSSKCCGLNPAGDPLLDDLVAGTDGHLEPYENPSISTIRFCGSPKE